MPSELMLLLYRGDRAGAAALAKQAPLLDIFEAAALGSLDELIQRIGDDPGSVYAYSDDGYTPLHLAAFFGSDACARELLRGGAAVDARARNGSNVTPLHSACAGNHTFVAITLIAAGADPNAEQQGGYRPLDSAERNGNTEIIEALRRAGATAERP